MRTFLDAKAMAKAMRETLAAKGTEITNSEALEIVARQFGLKDWNVLSAAIEATSPDSDAAISFSAPVPIFRIFDEDKAREYYVGFLDCKIDWEHRFHPKAPLYMQVSRNGFRLHLSEHAGDASPAATAVCYMKGIETFQKGLLDKHYKYNRPGLEKADWGLECECVDPFGNRIRFIESQG